MKNWYKNFIRHSQSSILIPCNSYWVAGSIFLIALIFHTFLSERTINVLHIFRVAPSLFCISYLQSTMALFGLSIRIFSILSVLVPGLLVELFNMPSTEAPTPFLHSPVETNWSTSVVKIVFSNTYLFFPWLPNIDQLMKQQLFADGHQACCPGHIKTIRRLNSIRE